MNAIELHSVVKRFGSQVAVNEVSHVVPEGVIHGFIGPNGSGKTTTLRMIMRILRPDSGRVVVLGSEHQTSPDDRVSYLPEERSVYKQMKVREALKFYAAMKSYRATDAEIAEWLERMQLPGVIDKKCEALSKGMNQKVQFIAAVISRPKMVLLDEPFSGLDPVNAVVLRDMIVDLKRDGTTVIFSTHDMAVAERMCDSIFMIYKGNKVLDGTLESIQQEYGSDTIRVRLDDAAAGAFDDLPGVEDVTDFGRYQELRIGKLTDTQAILSALGGRGRVSHFEISTPSLADIFVRIASPDLKGETALA
jgi:ABC-2 type transport system ATP-binding protein